MKHKESGETIHRQLHWTETGEGKKNFVSVTLENTRVKKTNEFTVAAPFEYTPCVHKNNKQDPVVQNKFQGQVASSKRGS